MRLDTKEKRLAARYKPEGALTVTDKASGAVAYIYTNRRNQPCAMIYTGTAGKPSAQYAFANEARRAEYVAKFFAAEAQRTEERKAHRAARNSAHSLQVGHILVSSWGYEQTNVDWYQVTRVISPKMVEIRKIAGRAVENDGTGNSMAGYCMPAPDQFIGEPTRHRANASNSVTVNGHYSARLWEGRQQYVSWYA